MPMTTVGSTAALLKESFARQVSQGRWETVKADNKHKSNCEEAGEASAAFSLDSWGSWAPQKLARPFSWRDMAQLFVLVAIFAVLGLLSSTFEWVWLLYFPSEKVESSLLDRLNERESGTEEKKGSAKHLTPLDQLDALTA